MAVAEPLAAPSVEPSPCPGRVWALPITGAAAWLVLMLWLSGVIG